MTKVAPASVFIRPHSTETARHALADLVLAWARDIESGEPRYIGEIDADHRGAKCGCECQSCGLPLIAVNAAKDEVQRRPHFRHPEGAQRDNCAILAARSAALRLLTEQGVIDLPRRGMPGQMVGLSGARHEAWAELPPQKVRISQIDFNDRAFAVLTLEDGRKLRVALTGSIREATGTAERVLVPTITIEVDGSLAGLDQAGLRKQLQLLPDAICWRSHWNDKELLDQADAKAREAAIEALDWPASDVDLPQDLSPELRRETLLHFEVKRILECARQITAPGFDIVEQLRADGMPTLQRKYTRDVCILDLTNTRLEQRVGRLIPDLVTQAWADGGQQIDPLHIEVTVTNRIDDKRIQRIQAAGVATLEIDLSLAGGRVTRSGLHHLVVHDLALKRWIVNPEMERVRRDLQEELQREMEQRREIERLPRERLARVSAEPLADVAQRYLAAVETMLVAAASSDFRERKTEIEAKQLAVGACVEEMRWHGFPEAGDGDLLGHHRILSRILSIKRDTGIGYRHRTAFEVLNAIQQSGDAKSSEWTLYLIAAKVYAPAMNSKQQDQITEWRDRVTRAIRAGDLSVMRDATYDRILGTLFPEMKDALGKEFGKRPQMANLPPGEKAQQSQRATQVSHRPASFLQTQGQFGLPMNEVAEGDPASAAGYFRGPELDAWKKANPKYVASWEPQWRKLGIS